MLFLLFEGDRGYEDNKGGETLAGGPYPSLEAAVAATSVKDSPTSWANIVAISGGPPIVLGWYNHGVIGGWQFIRAIGQYRNAPKPITSYKIRDNQTGLYSAGGVMPSWNKTGKVWANKAGLMNHLTLVAKELARREGIYKRGINASLRMLYIPLSWEVIEVSTLISTSRPAATYD